MDTMINEELRDHVTNVSFSLNLSKTQVKLLVMLHHFGGHIKMAKAGYLYAKGKPTDYMVSQYVSVSRSLFSRGLIQQTTPTKSTLPAGDHKLTRGGDLVIQLLKEAGIYQDTIEALQLNKSAA